MRRAIPWLSWSVAVLVIGSTLMVASNGPTGVASGGDGPATFTPLGDLDGGDFQSTAFGLSADGRVAVGQGTSPLGHEAYVWTRETGMTSLGPSPGFSFFGAGAISASDDGSVVVGIQQTALNAFQGF